MHLTGNNSYMQPTPLLSVDNFIFLPDLYKLCFLPLLLVFVMKCVKKHCCLPHNPHCYSLSSPVCLLHLFICTCINSSPIACPPSSMLCWCQLCVCVFLYFRCILCFFFLCACASFLLLWLLHWSVILMCSLVILYVAFLLLLLCFVFIDICGLKRHWSMYLSYWIRVLAYLGEGTYCIDMGMVQLCGGHGGHFSK